MKKITRRQFLKNTGKLGAASLIASSHISCPIEESDNPYYLEGKKQGETYRNEIMSAANNALGLIAMVSLPILERIDSLEGYNILQLILNQLTEEEIEQIKSQKNLTLEEKDKIKKTGINLFEAIGRIKETKKALKEHSPDNLIRSYGIADGASGGIFKEHYRDLLLLAGTLEYIPTCIGHLFAGKFEACSTLAVKAELTSNGLPAIIKNFDFSELVENLNIIRQTTIPEKIQSLETTTSIMPGSVTPTNGYLTMTQNMVLGEHLNNCNLPISCAMQEAIGKYTTIKQAFEFLNSLPLAGYYLITAVDSENTIGLLECSPLGNLERIISSDSPEKYLVVTNHYLENPGIPQGGLGIMPEGIGSKTEERHRNITLSTQQKLSQGKLTVQDLFEILNVAKRPNTQNTTLTYLSGKPEIICRAKNMPPYNPWEEFTVN